MNDETWKRDMLAVIDDALSSNEVEDLQSNRDLMRSCADTLRTMLRESDKRVAELESCVRGLLANQLSDEIIDMAPHDEPWDYHCVWCGKDYNPEPLTVLCTNPDCPAVKARAFVPDEVIPDAI